MRERTIMTFYMATTILIVLLMAAMTIHVSKHEGFNRRQKTWFILTFAAISFCALAEFAVHCGYYDPAFSGVLTVLTVLQFSIAPCFAMLFAGALGLRHQAKIALVYFGISLLSEVICAPFGWIFYFNDSGYFRSNAFIIYEILYFASLAYLIVVLVIVGKKFHHRDVGTIVMIMVVLVAGIIPMTTDGIHIAYLAVACSSVLCYVYYNDLVEQDNYIELIEKERKISSMQVHIISGLANLIESRDTETGEHVARTSAYVKALAEKCKEEGVFADTINDRYIELLYTLAPMHDVGKILVSDKILRKPGRLTTEEFEEIKKHVAYGGKVVRQILSGISDEEYLSFASDIATYHHEKWDGTGYPKGLKDKQIPLSARIMAIADVFDALVSKRCYKDAMSLDQAFQTIKDEAGTHFDPLLVDVFLRHKDVFVEIKNSILDKNTGE